jgi:hypothetical protein
VSALHGIEAVKLVFPDVNVHEHVHEEIRDLS